jgi:hypothetical protein
VILTDERNSIVIVYYFCSLHNLRVGCDPSVNIGLIKFYKYPFATNPEALDYFLFSLTADFGEIIKDYIADGT